MIAWLRKLFWHECSYRVFKVDGKIVAARKCVTCGKGRVDR